MFSQISTCWKLSFETASRQFIAWQLVIWFGVSVPDSIAPVCGKLIAERSATKERLSDEVFDFRFGDDGLWFGIIANLWAR